MFTERKKKFKLKKANNKPFEMKIQKFKKANSLKRILLKLLY